MELNVVGLERSKLSHKKMLGMSKFWTEEGGLKEGVFEVLETDKERVNLGKDNGCLGCLRLSFCIFLIYLWKD